MSMRSTHMAYRSMRFLSLALLGWICAWASGSAASVTPESVSIRFDRFSAEEGLVLSVSVPGDADGETTLSNETCCGIKDGKQFIHDVRVFADGRSVPVFSGPSGWTVRHAPRAALSVTYRLPDSGPMKIDGGTAEQMRPLVRRGLFHLIGRTALLLPTGRSGEEAVILDLDAKPVSSNGRFVSSFGAGAVLKGVMTTRRQVASALYLGGEVVLSTHDTPSGQIGIAYSGMEQGVLADELRKDVLSIVEAERAFFSDAQRWYLVSVHGGTVSNPDIKLGGGTGLTNSFAMFVDSRLDFSSSDHREPFRWVLAHEYFHQWNGLTLRVAPQRGTERDDTSVYWFSEGVTDFYTMRLLTRAGLQAPELSLAVLNNRLRRYAKNSKRDLSAREVGPLFWTDPDGEQIPYLRGYIAAWYVDLYARRSPSTDDGLDALMKTLVKRAAAEPEFRVDNVFLAAYLGSVLPAEQQPRLRRFLIEGGDVPLEAKSFGPCLAGRLESLSGRSTLQYEFSEASNARCFRH
jgi:hypothetical protein